MKKKTNHIIKSLAVAFLGGLSLCSCTDFLTIYPTDKTVGENFWKNKDQVDQMVTGAYTGMIILAAAITHGHLSIMSSTPATW